MRAWLRDRILGLLLRPRRYCSRDTLIRKLQKFTIQNVSLNAPIEENPAIEENAAVEVKDPKSSHIIEECCCKIGMPQ